MTFPVDGDLPFLHTFQQPGLGSGGGAVELVGQKNIGENRPPAEHKFVFAAVKNIHSRDISGQKIRCELYSGKLQIYGLCQSLCQLCLSGAWNIFQKHMTICQQRRQKQTDGLLLSDDHLTDLR